MQIAYPIEVSSRCRHYWVTIPDLPEAFAEGATCEEAYAVADACLLDTLQDYIRARRSIPPPSPAMGRPLVQPPLLVAAKIALYQAMQERKLSNVALARQLGTVEGTVRRLIDLRHRSHVDQLEAALATLGKRLFLAVRRG